MIHVGDALTVLRTMPSESVHCIVTSPPYFGLRDYGVDGQLGLERTPDEYLDKMVAVFREARRVLRSDGTCFVNMGDCYAHSGASGGTWNGSSPESRDTNSGAASDAQRKMGGTLPPGLKPKDLCGIPWRLALALQAPYVVPSCVALERDRAWLAAMFDGEGCIGIRRFDSYREEKQQVYQDGFVIYTVVTNNDRELLDRCIDLTGFGSIRLKQAADSTDGRGIVSRRDSFGWRLDGNKAVEIVCAIYPYLIAKRKQALIAYTLDRLNKSGHGSRSVPSEVQGKKQYLWELVKRCNQREAVDLPDWIEEPKQIVEPGWYLRADIIWHKPNPMPESVTDRPTKAHEYIFLLSKSARYFYDAEAIKEDVTGGAHPRGDGMNPKRLLGIPGENRSNPTFTANELVGSRNARSVWTIATQPFPEAHFATFPEALAERCIRAGTSERGCCPECGAPWERVVKETPEYAAFRENRQRADFRRLDRAKDAIGRVAVESPAGMPEKNQTTGWRPTCSHAGEPVPCTVLDPFGGAGTTGLVAAKLNRSWVLIELKPEYAEMAERRIKGALPLFAGAEALQ